MRLRFLIFSITIILNLQKLFCQVIVPTQKELYYIANIQFNGQSGTSFFYGTADKKYLLVTAKHLFKQTYLKGKVINKDTVFNSVDSLIAKNGDSITFQINQTKGWRKYRGRVYYNKNPDVDIAVIKHNIPVDSGTYNLDVSNSILGQDCFFPGYPLGLTMDKSSPSSGLRVPIIKKGSIAGLVNTDSGLRIYFIDGSNTYGLSGSPLLFYDYTIKHFKVFGVLSSYKTQANVSYDRKGKKIVQYENSGIFVGHSILHVKEIISQIR